MSCILFDHAGPMPEPEEIVTVKDLLAIAPDRIEACLADLRNWIAAARALGDWRQPIPPFVWIDDGHSFLYVTAPKDIDAKAIGKIVADHLESCAS